MLIAIDIDGTLTRWPRQVLHLGRLWGKLGAGRVVFLTGNSCPDPGRADRAALTAGRRDQLRAIGDGVGKDGDYEVHVCVGRDSGEVALQKAIYCRDNKVNLFIDDSINYCEAVRRYSPDTMVLWVHP